MDENLFNESFDNTFLQLNDLGNTNEHYLTSHKFNLFQQFFIIGLEPKIIFNLNKIEINSLPKKFLEPTIISKYPNISLPYLCIPDNIVASHCFPNGSVDIIIKDENTEILKDSNFIFSLDNHGYDDKENSLKTRKVYYACYYFYESVENYNLFINLRKQTKNEINYYNKKYYIKKVICLSSFQPLYKEANKILRYLKKYIGYYSLNYKDGEIKIIKNNFFPIEKIIEGLIFNIPSLPRSKYTLQMSVDIFNFDFNNKDKEKLKKEIIFKESTINKLPKPFVDISNLLYFFNIDEIYEIIKWIILEVPILFFCENINDLTFTIEGFRSLIYPFEYSYPIVSILPEENYSMISILKHFIFGINYKYSKDILIKKGINIQYLDMIVIVFAFLFVDIFDTLGTIIGCAEKANMLDKDGKLPKIKEVLLADAVATTAGAVLGTSTTTTFVESSSGIAEGARTGLASIVTGLLFLVSIVLAPIFIAIPGFATAPALIYVGFLMLAPILDIKFDDLTEAIPAYIALLSMPLLYSISEGIAFGVISYVVINLISKKSEKITPLMYILAILFVLKYLSL